MNELLKALEDIKNNYDAFYFVNKYGNNTHQKQFELLESKLNEEIDKHALGWIKNCYDCYYKDELDDSSAFAYLENRIKNCGSDENAQS